MENEFLIAAKNLLEHERKLNNLAEHDFRWLHLGCDLQEPVEIKNSVENDPASGDPRPVFVKSLYCEAHGATSAVIDLTQGV